MPEPLSSAQVRARLELALRLDLVGPFEHDEAYLQERLPEAPSRWYLTGFLVPSQAPEEQRWDPGQQDEIALIEGDASMRDDDAEPERATKLRQFFPSSMGMSVLTPPEAELLQVELSWGDYVAQEPDPSAKRARLVWQREQRRASLTLELPSTPVNARQIQLPEHPGVQIVYSARPVAATPEDVTSRVGGGLPEGALAVSVFVVNAREPVLDEERKDEAFMFQASLTLRCAQGFLPRPNPRGQRQDDELDERLADLQHRHEAELAAGHNVATHARYEPPSWPGSSSGASSGLSAHGSSAHGSSAHGSSAHGSRRCCELQTRWIPRAFVSRQTPNALDSVQVKMEDLAELAASPDEGRALEAALQPLVEAYAAWIRDKQGQAPPEAHRQEVWQIVLGEAARANARIQAGVQALRQQPGLRRAFGLMNQAMAMAARRQRPEQTPRWRLFQLAFVLLNLPSAADPSHPERGCVELIYFPTGGGKTEAYLGLAALTLLLRRLRHQGQVTGAGVSVLMRYTLRLLTLDQLSRATTLICALELLREQHVQELGVWPFEIGLWVGAAATPNRLGGPGALNKEGTAYHKLMAFKRDPKHEPSPIPLERCPWCQAPFDQDSFQLVPHAQAPRHMEVRCVRRGCEFAASAGRVLPLVAVDEPLYERLPCFIIATVDKFANMPWVGQTGALLGRGVHRHDERGFYGPCDPQRGRPLPGGAELDPPDLIIQDELHLISGPLGTMVGLYESAIDALATRPATQDQPARRPKIVASTATIRRAQSQCRALFGRPIMALFPPPSPELSDSFFAQSQEDPLSCRQYLGVAAPGRSLKVSLLRTYLALMSAAQRVYDEQAALLPAGQPNPADPYMSLLGYFGSLRELGGSRRIVEDEVLGRLSDYSKRRRLDEPEEGGFFADRKISFEALELTSRESTSRVAQAKQRLASPFDPDDRQRVDVALASNMISVGLDITRLGLMVVLGQPKATAEYIQATSRVGRDPQRPGLVVTLYHVHRPRDRSHYERFETYHRAFYRDVEATSVTPFSPRALERGLVGVTVALARHGVGQLTPALGAKRVASHRAVLSALVAGQIADRARDHRDGSGGQDHEQLRARVYGQVQNLLERWIQKAQLEGPLRYQSYEGQEGKPLLFYPLDPRVEELPLEERVFTAQRSLRSVEPSVNVWVKRLDGAQPHDTE